MSLDDTLKKIKARKSSVDNIDKKMEVLIRRAMNLGANMNQFRELGFTDEQVLPLYHSMPPSFHQRRAKAVVDKMKKNQESQNG